MPKPVLSHEHIIAFQKYIYGFYKVHGRHDLPWRQSFDPYQVLVSEIMLQQTQVERVIPKFEQFLAVFPSVEKLAVASVADVIKQWQGLGYNRRGLNLQKAAQQIVCDFDSQIPQETNHLISLKGIGPYTAAAIQAFAFNLPSVVIETNIRTIFLFHFFHGADKVSDSELYPWIEQTLDKTQPRHWYSALMDYGTHLKSVLPNPSRRSKEYAKQSTFQGSNRQARGEVLRIVSQQPALSKEKLFSLSTIEPYRLEQALTQLVKEGFITYQASQISLPK